MPTISTFFGITIRMYFGDHPPPHFHAYYQDGATIFAIDSLEVLDGSIPRRARNLVVEWALEQRPQLRENWRRCEAGLPLLPVEPLE